MECITIFHLSVSVGSSCRITGRKVVPIYKIEYMKKNKKEMV